MASDIVRQQTLLDELDARQDDVLGRLDDLNQRIEALLHDFIRPAAAPEGAPDARETPLNGGVE